MNQGPEVEKKLNAFFQEVLQRYSRNMKDKLHFLQERSADILNYLENEMELPDLEALRQGFNAEVEKSMESIRQQYLQKILWQQQFQKALLSLYGGFSQREVLERLLDATHLVSNRCLLMILRRGNLAGWNSRGLAGEPAEEFKGLQLPMAEQPFFQAATGKSAVQTVNAGQVNQCWPEAAGSIPEKVLVVPLTVFNAVTAFLVIDADQLRYSEEEAAHSLEIAALIGSVWLENLAMRKSLGLVSSATQVTGIPPAGEGKAAIFREAAPPVAPRAESIIPPVRKEMEYMPVQEISAEPETTAEPGEDIYEAGPAGSTADSGEFSGIRLDEETEGSRDDLSAVPGFPVEEESVDTAGTEGQGPEISLPSIDAAISSWMDEKYEPLEDAETTISDSAAGPAGGEPGGTVDVAGDELLFAGVDLAGPDASSFPEEELLSPVEPAEPEEDEIVLDELVDNSMTMVDEEAEIEGKIILPEDLLSPAPGFTDAAGELTYEDDEIVLEEKPMEELILEDIQPEPAFKPPEISFTRDREAAARAAEAEKPAWKTPEEEKLHNDARRFARLLVSEIKLYNEDAVTEGRIEKDLYRRLKRDIDRSREMFDKRVATEVARQNDYFHEELVRILAEGDPAKMGTDYSGPRRTN